MKEAERKEGNGGTKDGGSERAREGRAGIE